MLHSTTLSGWIALRRMDITMLVKQFQLKPDHIRHNAIYGQVSRLTECYMPDSMPGRVYFQGSDFLLLYISQPTVTLSELQAIPLLASCVPDALPSRAGKRHRQFVYPAQGIAFSADVPDGEVDFVEVFVPMTMLDYRTTLYIEPDDFIR